MLLHWYSLILLSMNPENFQLTLFQFSQEHNNAQFLQRNFESCQIQGPISFFASITLRYLESLTFVMMSSR